MQAELTVGQLNGAWARCADNSAAIDPREAIHACAGLSAVPMTRHDGAVLELYEGGNFVRFGAYPQAIQALSFVVNWYKGWPMAYVERGYAYGALGHSADAERDFDTALEWGRRDARIYNDVCRARTVLDLQLGAALIDCNGALTLAPDTAAYLDTRCFLHFRRGENKAAIADCTAALARNPKPASSLYVRGMAEGSAGEADRGAADIAAAVARDPRLPALYASYGLPAARGSTELIPAVKPPALK